MITGARQVKLLLFGKKSVWVVSVAAGLLADFAGGCWGDGCC